MSSSIGKAALTLTTNATGLYGGLDGASGKIRSWANGLKGIIGGGLKAVVTGFGAGLGVGAMSSIGGFIGKAFDRLPEIAKIASTGQAFGLSAEKFSGMAGLAKQAGSDIRDFTEALSTLSGRADEAATGGIVASQMFSQLGIRAADFKQLKIDDQFYGIMKAINAVKNPAEQVGLLFRAFGEDSGKNLISLLGKSDEELRKMSAGFAMSSNDIARAEIASQSLTQANAALSRAYDNVLISMTPVFQYASDEIPAAVEGMQPVFEGLRSTVIPVFRALSMAAGYFWDGLKAGLGVFEIVIGELLVNLSRMAERIERIAGLAEKLPESIRPDWVMGLKDDVKIWGDALKEVGKQTIDQGYGRLKNFGQSGVDARAFFDTQEAKREKGIEKRAKEISKESSGLSTSKAQNYVGNAAAIKGSTEDNAIRARFANDQLAKTDVPKQQLDAQRAAVAVLNVIKDRVSNLLPFKVL